MGNFIQRKVAETVIGKAAKNLPKEEFLRQLEEEWTKLLKNKPIIDIEAECKSASRRIQSSPFRFAFHSAKITDEDIRGVLIKIKETRNAK